MRLRLTGTLVLVTRGCRLASASAYARDGNGDGYGNGKNGPAVAPNTSDSTRAPVSSPADPSTPAKLKPVVSPHSGGVESASGVLSARGAIGGGTLRFTGFRSGSSW